MRTLINLSIKCITQIYILLSPIFIQVSLILASILTMSEHFRLANLKRKLIDSLEMTHNKMKSFAEVVKGPAQSGPSYSQNPGQGNYSQQVTPGRDDRRKNQSFQYPPVNHQRKSSSGDKNRHQEHHDSRQSFDTQGRCGNKQRWDNSQSYNKGDNRGGKKGQGRNRGNKNWHQNTQGNHQHENRRQSYDKNKSRDLSQGQEFSFDHRQESQTARYQSSTTDMAQRSRQNSESKDNSDWSLKQVSQSSTMSHLSVSSVKSPSSESTKFSESRESHSLSTTETSSLPPESPPSDQTRKPLCVTSLKDHSLSERPASSETKEKTNSTSQSKKPPGLSGSDPGTKGMEKSGSKNAAEKNTRSLPDKKMAESQESGKVTWKGVDIKELRRAPECFKECTSGQVVNEAADHHPDRLKIQHGGKFVPQSFVHLPHQYEPRLADGCSNIAYYLGIQINDVVTLERVMIEIANCNPYHYPQNNRYNNPQDNPYERMNFGALEAFFKTLSNDEYHRFFTVTLPEIQKLALRLPHLFQEPLPILRQRVNQEVTLSQHQIACLLANAFFDTIPQQNHQNKGKPLQMPDFNFINLYSHMKKERKVEKLKCIVNYFERVTSNMPDGNVTFKRVYGEPVKWETMEKKLTKLHVSTEGTIEDERGFLQADFANKFVGGGVLNTGLVQEEIRFVLCPEMIISRLITEMLTNDEVLLMIGCERFNSYSGYSDTFKFTGDFIDDTERDEHGRKYTEVVAMDASVFKTNYYDQFEIKNVTRELNKAHCAFKGSGARNLPAVCTGNWGCGAFGGDKQLKALIQLMAASVANRDICYLTFGDAELCLQIGHMYDLLTSHNKSIKDIMQILTAYSKITTDTPLFTFMEGMISGNAHRPEEEKPSKSDSPPKFKP